MARKKRSGSQPMMSTGTVISQAMVDAREKPQPRQDNTVVNRQAIQAFQNDLAPIGPSRPSGTPSPGGLPAGIDRPGLLSCPLLSDSDNVTALAWDAYREILAVANGDSIDFLKQTGAYWVRESTIKPGESITDMAMYRGHLFANGASISIYRSNYKDSGTEIEVKGATPIVSAYIGSVDDDDNPLWPEQVDTSYQREDVPGGEYLGFTTQAEAEAAGDVGDWYNDQGDYKFYQFGGIGPSDANLLLWSEDFSVGTWSKQGDTTITEGADPFQGSPDWLLTSADHSVGGNHVRQQVTIDAGKTFTASIYAKAGTLDTLKFRTIDQTGGTTQDLESVFNLGDGTLTSNDAGTTPFIESVGDGWYRCGHSFTPDASNTVFQLRLSAASGSGTINVTRGQLVESEFEAGDELQTWNFNQPPVELFADDFERAGDVLLEETFTNVPQDIINDTFNRTDPAPWEPYTDPASETTLAISNGELVLGKSGTSTGITRARQPLAVEQGKWYSITATRGSVGTYASPTTIGIGTNWSADLASTTLAANATGTVFYYATADANLYALAFGSNTNAADASYSSVVVQEIKALDGWVPNANAVVKVENGQLKLESDGSGVGEIYKEVATTAGTNINAQFDFVYTSGSSTTLRIGNGGGTIEQVSAGATAKYNLAGPGVSTSTRFTMRMGTSSAGTVATLNSVVAKDGGALSPWTDTSTGTGTARTVNNQLRLVRGVDSSNIGSATYERTVEVGKWYRASVKYVSGTAGNGQLLLGTSTGGTQYANVVGAAGTTLTATFRATATALFSRVICGANGNTQFFDDFLLEEVVALEGWESNQGAGGAIVNSAMQVVGSANFASELRTEITLQPSTNYVLRGDVSAPSGQTDAASLIVGDSSGNFATIDVTVGNSVSGEERKYTTPASFTGNVYVKARTAGTTAGDLSIYDNISLLEAVLEIPVYRATTAANARTEIFRAGKANFPNFFAIAAEAGRVIIYDLEAFVGTEPTMWMVFTGGSSNMMRYGNTTSVTYTNGEIQSTHGPSGGRISYNFFADNSVLVSASANANYAGNIAQRNNGLSITGNISSERIVSSDVNAGAVKVLGGPRQKSFVVIGDSNAAQVGVPTGTALAQTRSWPFLLNDAGVAVTYVDAQDGRRATQYTLPDGIVSNEDVDSAVIALGSNDALALVLSQITIDEFIAAYKGIVNGLIARGFKEIYKLQVLQSNPPTEVVDLVNDAIRDIDGGTFWSAGGDTYLDALHLDQNGQNRYAEVVSELIEPTPDKVGGTIARNLLRWSEDFTKGVWTATNATKNKITLIEDASTGVHSVAQSFTVAANATYTASAYLEAAGRRYVVLALSGGAAGYNHNVAFDLEAGTAVGTISASEPSSFGMVKEGGGWRCYITQIATGAANPQFIAYLSENGTSLSYAGDGESGAVITELQIEQSATPHEYVPSNTQESDFDPVFQMDLTDNLDITTGTGPATFTRSTTATYVRDGVLHTAAINEPRFEDAGLLVEGESTNVALWSNDLTNGVWSTINGGTVSKGQNYSTVTAPSLNAGVFQNLGVITASTTHTVSFITQSLDGGVQKLGVTNGVDGDVFVLFNPQTKAASVTGSGTSTVRTFGSLDIVSITYTSAASGNSLPIVYGGEATVFRVYGVQIEALPFATSYIPTEASAVTRADDICRLPTDAFPANNVAQTWAVDADYLGALNNFQDVLSVTGESFRILRMGGTGGINPQFFFGNNAASSPAVDANVTARYAGSFASLESKRLFTDGEPGAVPPTATAVTGTATAIMIGATGPGAFELYGHIKNLKVYNTAIDLGASVPTVVPPARQLVNRTNLILHSEDFTQSAWSKGSSLTVTGNAETAPDGTQTADRVDSSGVGTANDSRIVQTTANGTLPAGAATATDSIWFKGVNGGETIALQILNRLGGELTTNNITLTTEWVRYDVSATFTASEAGARLQIVPISPNIGSPQSYFVWGAQVEQGGFATPYIPTGATAASRTDDVNLPIPTWAVATAGGVSVGVDSGSVWDGTTSGGQAISVIDFTSDDKVFSQAKFRSRFSAYNIPMADYDLDTGYLRRYFPSVDTSTDVGAPRINIGTTDSGNTVAIAQGGVLSFGDDDGGLTLINEDIQNYLNGTYHWATTTYNTGPHSRPDGAWANGKSDFNTDGEIGIPFSLVETFDAPNVEVFRDEFNRTDVGPDWQVVNGTLSINSNRLRLTYSGTGAPGAGYQVATEVGKWYRFRADFTKTDSNGSLRLRDAAINGTPVGTSSRGNTGPLELYVKAISTNSFFTLEHVGAAAGDTSEWDNAIIEEVPALEGWENTSVGNGTVSIENGEVVLSRTDSSNLGAIQKSFAASGNYLINSELGTGSAIRLYMGSTSGANDLNNQLNSAAQGNLFGVAHTGTVFLRYFPNANGDARINSIAVQQALVQNGTFDSDTAWTKGTGWTIAGGVAQAAAGSASVLQQAFTAEVGKAYTLQFTVSGISGGGEINVFIPGAASEQITADGTYLARLVAGSASGNVGVNKNANFAGTVDNLILTDGLPDRSVAGNNGQVNGVATKDSGFNQCIDGVCVTGPNNIFILNAQKGVLSGWYKPHGNAQLNYEYYADLSVLDAVILEGDNFYLTDGCYGWLTLTGPDAANPTLLDLGSFADDFGDDFS